LPSYATEDSAGADLCSNSKENIFIPPGHRKLIPTGLYMQVPKGYELQIRPRSGLAVKHGIAVLNAPGTIDADYRGEIMVILINHGDKQFKVRKGDRIAQCVLSKCARANWVEVPLSALSKTERDKGGFGHTGKN
jgi:dUTP pyrophosphatase